MTHRLVQVLGLPGDAPQLHCYWQWNAAWQEPGGRGEWCAWDLGETGQGVFRVWGLGCVRRARGRLETRPELSFAQDGGRAASPGLETAPRFSPGGRRAPSAWLVPREACGLQSGFLDFSGLCARVSQGPGLRRALSSS